MEKQYRPFKSDDIIEEGDQVQSISVGEWMDFKSMCFGQIINPDLVLQSRKLIKSSDDTTVSQTKKSWTRDEVIKLCQKCWLKTPNTENMLKEFQNWIQQNL